MEKTEELRGCEIHTSMFKELIALTDEYFGIGYGYFLPEIQSMKGWNINTDNESSDLDALELDECLLFIHSIDIDKLSSIFSLIEEDDDSDTNIGYALLLLGNIIKDKDYFKMMEYICDITEGDIKNDIVREDLLKLYIWLNDPKTNLRQKITIKHAMGNIDLENFDSWFTRHLLKKHQDKYLSDITSVEQAKAELQSYKRKKGRKLKDMRVPVIIYGLFRMINEQKKMKSPQSDSLCEFIIEYLKFIGVFDHDTDVDNQWIRGQIAYLKTKPTPPKFGYMGVMRKASLEDLEKTGRRMY